MKRSLKFASLNMMRFKSFLRSGVYGCCLSVALFVSNQSLAANNSILKCGEFELFSEYCGANPFAINCQTGRLFIMLQGLNDRVYFLDSHSQAKTKNLVVEALNARQRPAACFRLVGSQDNSFPSHSWTVVTVESKAE